MTAFDTYLNDFFAKLSMDSDRLGHSYRIILSESIRDFLQSPTKERAYVVYKTFFDIYRFHMETNRSFLDLLDLLRGYEEKTGSFTDKQRDHYVHSVNVFLLGICFFTSNVKIQAAFKKRYLENKKAVLYSTANEEFLYEWGITSLFHDIGYPVELIQNQAKNFVGFVANEQIKPYLSFQRFNQFDNIETEHNLLDPFSQELQTAGCDPFRPTDILGFVISKQLGLDCVVTKQTVNRFLETMQTNGFVDHGFYSALIVLKWYGELLIPNEIVGHFYSCIAECATAIFLHNAYKNVIRKAPFNRNQLQVEDFPLAFLLILCDEAQEWNRESYGSKVDTNILIDDTNLYLSNEKIEFYYITKKGFLEESFLSKKRDAFYHTLDISSIVSNGLYITATKRSDVLLEQVRHSLVLPRMLIENIEQLAKLIHSEYNKKQVERDENAIIRYPTWDSLPDTLKYSNIRQAQSISEKLELIGCYTSVADGRESYVLSEQEVEYLANYEHSLWVKEREETGWQYGSVKDVGKKTTPYLVPYDDLEDEIKELDRDTIRNIPKLLENVGLIIVKPERT